MQIFKNPKPDTWEKILQRPTADYSKYRAEVQPILDAVKANGDEALRFYSKKFDGFSFENMQVSEEEMAESIKKVDEKLKNALQIAFTNLYKFHEKQKEKPLRVETMPGVICSRKSLPIDKVGLYVPGGSAPLFSTMLMLGIPALIADCQEVVVCTPVGKDGKINPAVLYAAHLCKIKKIFKVGGAQAIAAMAFGTETVPKVYKIFGPGNPWVTAAKQLISLEGVAIDLPAGPSEVAVIADKTANPDFVAADLLSQAEHGADSQVIFITNDKNLLKNVQISLENQLKTLPRAEIAKSALANSKSILVKNLDEAMQISNVYAPEHLILQVKNPQKLAQKVTNAGSVFLGHLTPESAGDYASGTNHTLPTGGYARAYAGVSLDSFMKKITFQEISKEGLAVLGPVVMEMARGERLEAHARAIEHRLDRLN
jgi:histidinol dehydrogenase